MSQQSPAFTSGNVSQVQEGNRPLRKPLDSLAYPSSVPTSPRLNKVEPGQRQSSLTRSQPIDDIRSSKSGTPENVASLDARRVVDLLDISGTVSRYRLLEQLVSSFFLPF